MSGGNEPEEGLRGRGTSHRHQQRLRVRGVPRCGGGRGERVRGRVVRRAGRAGVRAHRVDPVRAGAGLLPQTPPAAASSAQPC